MLKEGLIASGNYAHEAEVSYMNELKFTDYEISFVNVLRSSRNGINYYGKIFEEDYAKECYNFLTAIMVYDSKNFLKKDKNEDVYKYGL